MSESLALARLLFLRSRIQLIGLSAWLAMSVVIAVAWGLLFDREGAQPVLILLAFPVVIWSLAMFEFGTANASTGIQSGYNHWLLRLPLANWKLTYVPLAMRFVWCTIVFATLWIALRWSARVWLPAGPGLILFWAGGAWMSAILWRPFRSVYLASATVVVACIVYYVLFACWMSVQFDKHSGVDLLRSNPGWLKTLLTTVIVFAFGSGMVLALSAVKLARTNSAGKIPERASSVSGASGGSCDSFSSDVSNAISHRSGPAALAWHDLRRWQMGSERWVLSAMIVGAMLLMTLLPLPVVTAMFVMLLVTQAGAMSGSAVLEPTKLSGTSLPAYLAVSPLTCSQIGFSRAWTGVWTSYVGIAILAVAYVVCFFMPSNRRVFMQWVEQTNGVYSDSFAAYRWIAVIIIAVIAAVPSRSLGFLWPTMTGRSRLSLAALILPILVMLTAGGITVAWFLQQAQADWETTISNAWYWATWIPTLLGLLLVVKFTASAIAGVLTRQAKLISTKTTVLIVATWLVATLALAAIAQTLIPDYRIQFAWTLMVTALLLPLGRVLVLPYAVSLNRYR